MYYSIYDQNSRLCLTINLTPVGFMAGFKHGLCFIVMIEDRVDINKNIHMLNP